jgi:hypothetical protein
MNARFRFRGSSVFASLIAALTMLVGPSLQAQEAVLEAVDSGNYSSEGDHSPTNSNYLAGDTAAAGVHERRNFFVFDLSGLPAPVLDAALAIYNPSDPPDGGDGFSSPDPFETYTTFEVTTDPATVMAGGTGLTGIFDDLGDGTAYGSVDVTGADNGSVIVIPLDQDAVASINVAFGGLWAVGGAVTTLDGNPLQIVFGYSDDSMPRQLVLDMGGTVFWDGFETGDFSMWSAVYP